MVLQVRFDGKVLIPLVPVDLPTDRLLQVDVREADSPPLGSPERIKKMLESLPPLEPGDAAAMMQEINAAKQAADYRGIFDHESGSHE